MNLFDQIVLLLTGLVAIYAIWRIGSRYRKEKNLYDVYYLLGFVVLLVSGLLLIFLGYGILASPYILTVASLIPLGLSMGLMNQFMPRWKKIYSWFALIGILAIAITSITGSPLKKVFVPLFHGVAGLIIFLVPIKASIDGKAAKGFLVGGGRRRFNWAGWDRVSVPIGRYSIIILQPGFRLNHIGSSVTAHDPGVHMGLYKRRSSFITTVKVIV
jgi:hypothetical protein